MKTSLNKRRVKNPDRSPRVNCSLPIEVDGFKGAIKDISTTGVYLELSGDFQPDVELKICIDMNTPGGVIQFDLTGNVVRVVQKDGVLGVGVKIKKQDLRQRAPTENISSHALQNHKRSSLVVPAAQGVQNVPLLHG